jgi:hypothetical protein
VGVLSNLDALLDEGDLLEVADLALLFGGDGDRRHITVRTTGSHHQYFARQPPIQI